MWLHCCAAEQCLPYLSLKGIMVWWSQLTNPRPKRACHWEIPISVGQLIKRSILLYQAGCSHLLVRLALLRITCPCSLSRAPLLLGRTNQHPKKLWFRRDISESEGHSSCTEQHAHIRNRPLLQAQTSVEEQFGNASLSRLSSLLCTNVRTDSAWAAWPCKDN